MRFCGLGTTTPLGGEIKLTSVATYSRSLETMINTVIDRDQLHKLNVECSLWSIQPTRQYNYLTETIKLSNQDNIIFSFLVDCQDIVFVSSVISCMVYIRIMTMLKSRS
jgi:hypothetical protein